MELNILTNNRGQAALTDALFFLLIVTGLAVFLFTISNSYGTTVSAQIALQSNIDYATSALKTILYSSTPRHPGDELLDPEAEIDYLLAYLKEDYADDQVVDDETKVVLAEVVSSIMMPLADSYDYLFYIYKPDTSEFLFVFFHMSQFQKTGKRFVTITPSEPKEFFCGLNPANPNRNTMSMDKLSQLVENIGITSKSSARIILLEQLPDREPAESTGEASLIMWPATSVEKLFSVEDWNCKTVEEVEQTVSEN